MASSSIQIVQYWCWKTARVLLACLLIATLLGSLDPSLQSAGSRLIDSLRQQAPSFYKLLPNFERSAQDRDAQAPGQQTGPSLNDLPLDQIYSERITIVATKQDVAAHFDIAVNKEHPLYKLIQETIARPYQQWSENDRLLIYELLGTARVGEQSLQPTQAALEIDAATLVAHIHLDSDATPYEFLLNDQKAEQVAVEVTLPFKRDRLCAADLFVEATDVRVFPVDIVPTAQSDTRTEFSDIANITPSSLRFNILLPPKAATETLEPIAAVMSRLNEAHAPVFEPLLLGLLYSLPFLLFLRLKRYSQIRREPKFTRYFEVAILLLVLYYGQAVLRACSDLTWFGPIWVTGKRPDSFLWGQPLVGAGALVILFPALIWPGIVRHWWRQIGNRAGLVIPDVISRPRRKVIGLIATVAIGLWLTTAFFVVEGKGAGQAFFDIYTVSGTGIAGTVTKVNFHPALALLLVALYIACLWLMYEIYGKRVAISKALVVTLALLVFQIAELFTYRYHLRDYLIVILTAPFIFAIARTFLPLMRTYLFKRHRLSISLLTHAGGFLCIFIVLLLLIRGSGQYTTSWFIVSSIAWAVSRLGIFALLGMLLHILREFSPSTNEQPLPKAARSTGLVLALTFFFLPAQEWLFLPVVFLLGYILLDKWAFVSTVPVQTVGDQQGQLPQTVREVLNLNDAERGLRLLRKEMLTKLGKGEVDYEAYAEKTSALEKTIEEKRRSLRLDSNSESTAVLALGLVVSPWERAKRGTIYGLIFALPWIIVFLRNFRENSLPSTKIEFLSLLTSAVLTILQWPLYGFFLCYFYPYMRGSDGMQKGLRFFLLIFIPTFVATILARPGTSDAWLLLLFWGLQLFIQSMLLGLIAGDYETLRRAGLSWRYLLDVHNLGALAAWGSSVLVAIGVAITTLLTSGVSSLITSGLKVLIPEMPTLGK